MGQEEQVLVVERRVLEQVGMFQGIAPEVDRYLNALFVPGVPRYMLRSHAETNPAYKQLIPYVIITCGDQVLSYVRGKRAGETRLVGLRSIGIGGHVNPVDDMPLFSADSREAYLAAVEREVAEEVSVETNHTDRVIALLNDDSTEVGSVHLGIVHHWTLDSPNVSKREQMITQMGFMSLADLHAVRETMETWSQLCLDHLMAMADAAK
jgi:predicted NUDIX family phosphoesterase